MLNLQPVSTSFFLMIALVVTGAGISLSVRYQAPVKRPDGVLMLRIDFDMLSYILYAFGVGFLSAMLLFQILLHQLQFSMMDYLFIVQVRAGRSVPVLCGFVLEHLQVGILVLGSYDNKIDINRAVQIVGGSDKIVAGMPILRVWAAREKLLKNQAGVDIFVCAYRLSVNEAKFPFNIKISPVLNGNQARISLTKQLGDTSEFYSDRRTTFRISFERITDGKA